MTAAADLRPVADTIQRLAVNVQYSRQNDVEDPESREQLLDALDDLRGELVGPMQWPGTFLAPPEFAALQVAFQHNLFQLVPVSANNAITNGDAHPSSAPLTGLSCTASISPSIHAKDLASAASMDEDRLIRIMRVLAVNKMFYEVDEHVFAHTQLSAGLANEYVAARLGGIFNDVYKASSSLADAIAGGFDTAWEARFGMPMYEYFEKTDSRDRDRMAKAMVISSTQELEELAQIFPWDRFRKVVDMGGGAGHLPAHLALRYPHLLTVNQDLPQVISDAIRRVEKLPAKERAVYDRVEFEAHSYFEPQTRTDADAFVLRRCLHNNADSDCIRILKAIVPSLAHSGSSGTRVLINEKIMPSWNASSVRWKSKMIRREDIVMMISVGGKERTLEEFEALVKAADERCEIDQVYHGKNHFAVISVKLVSNS